MHSAEDEGRAYICRAQAGELYDVLYARVLHSIDECRLSLHHMLVGGGDQQNTIHPGKCLCQRLRTQHVAFYNLHRGKRRERACLCSAPDQRPHGITGSNEFANHGKAGQPARTCDKNLSLNCFRHCHVSLSPLRAICGSCLVSCPCTACDAAQWATRSSESARDVTSPRWGQPRTRP